MYIKDIGCCTTPRLWGPLDGGRRGDGEAHDVKLERKTKKNKMTHCIILLLFSCCCSKIIVLLFFIELRVTPQIIVMVEVQSAPILTAFI
jgi:hypothetical protein